MSRFFLEVAYMGTHYSGFQIQHNANTVQAELERALRTYFREDMNLTGSSRTDTGVHAFQNFFQVDTELSLNENHLYNINAILPADIVLKSIRMVKPEAHCRFDATGRSYTYFIYQQKNPFYRDRGWFYPYPLDMNLLKKSAEILLTFSDFRAFSKRNTQVKTFICHLTEAYWEEKTDSILFHVSGNRFLRGMVRGLVGTMLKVGRGQLTLSDLPDIIESGDCRNVDFSTPPKGLFLESVRYPETIFHKI